VCLSHSLFFICVCHKPAVCFVHGQWLCNADKSSHEPRLRLKYAPEVIFCNVCLASLQPINFFNLYVCIFCRAFFGSLYRCLARGARAVLQFYADNVKQSEMIVTYAMRAGFAGGVVVDWPHR
jgi:18S rRNA (guanine1575-N7)-methyltransferase